MLKNFLLLNILAFGLLSANLVQAKIPSKEDKSAEQVNTYELLNIFGEVMESTKSMYVEEVTDKQLIEAAINGMLSSLDPHSSYLTAEDFKYLSEQTQGKFSGLGIEITMENGVVKVISPIDDTPAAKAGIKAGDYIIEIDGETVLGLNLDEVVGKLRGKTGTKVEVTIRRENKKPFKVSVRRAEIKVESVKNDIKEGDVLYVRISSFNDNTDSSVRKAIEEARKKLKNKLSGIVIDVRNADEYADGHINGSINIPVENISTVNYDKETVIIVYCASGMRSADAAKELISLGYTNVYNLDGGIINWDQELVTE